MNNTTPLTVQAILLLQSYIKQLGFTPVIHFELEGCYQFDSKIEKFSLDYQRINRQLVRAGIDGELVPEYWNSQWEYVSLFNGQSPLKEADNLSQAIKFLPRLFAEQGISTTLIKPVVWSGDKGKLASGSGDIFTTETRAVHIPNAVQMNISALDSEGKNIIVERGFGEYLQQCFLDTSLNCCLIYLPEEEAFERLALKSKYGLAAELCSPIDISGGHQGSIALYKEVGKHNQAMGEEPLLYDHNNKVLVKQHNWQKTARIEHRIGASSLQYNAYFNIIYSLLNLIDALEVYNTDNCRRLLRKEVHQQNLPSSLHDNTLTKCVGAISLFDNDHWFSERLNKIFTRSCGEQMSEQLLLGDKIKQMILAPYQQKLILTHTL
ncbi:MULTISPECIES: hypothetical protein [unclassified Colwellia]|uniref:hypothetical protein n=1 Tax=unclassified Colwellia TaxID=196834 RepID=UPI0015F47BE7|nr:MULTISPECIES: hypothetical protein [unclassified Colwellia]MBA6233281.1 hypothetical protein [Colwellia sp. MB02u-7]MBA6236371.1 hypothetical protein [Colwellia sp. MB02u-11]MBA6256905.1 hypothetical protein [Colwellia sp. MB3u-28]MBA6261089.1 hypothetical protein [Colwellia sp. MB3u-41]MBA6298229.1 hypothetical protein [Colwellia sp. MB3u-22]